MLTIGDIVKQLMEDRCSCGGKFKLHSLELYRKPKETNGN
jgi:hypothetical protein